MLRLEVANWNHERSPDCYSSAHNRGERDRLEAEANRLRLTPDGLATKLLQEQLAQVPVPLEALEALAQLRKIAQQMPPTDAVQLARESRADLEERGGF